jgi:hypothetical protein
MIMNFIKMLWIGASVLVLLVTLYGFDGKPSSDIEVLLGWYMLSLSFPSGLLISLIAVVLNDVLSITIVTSYFEIVLVWVGFYILGYLQWFKLLPYLITKLLTNLKNNKTGKR